MGSAHEQQQAKKGKCYATRCVFDKSQKQAMIDKVTNAMVEVEGEAMRGVTWVRVYEVASGEWAIGGKALSAADVKAMRARPQ